MNETKIAIVGAGVLGLSCAVELSEAGHQVTVIAKELPGDLSIDYASPWAGAHFRPSPAKTHAEKVEQQMMRETYARFEELAVQQPESGISFVSSVEYFDSVDLGSILDPESGYVDWPEFRIIPKEEYPANHESVRLGVSYRGWVLNSPVYLQWLKAKAEGLGVCFVKKQVSTHEDAIGVLSSKYSVCSHHKRSQIIVVNATGRGLQDPASFPSRGQFVHVSNECSRTISHHWADGSSTVIIPRPLGGGTIVGGTKEPNEWSDEISEAATTMILDRAVKLEPELLRAQDLEASNPDGLDVLQIYVARRPMRHGGLRLEIEKLESDILVVHCYGAGPSGFKISWGVAKRVHKLVFDLQLSTK